MSAATTCAISAVIAFWCTIVGPYNLDLSLHSNNLVLSMKLIMSTILFVDRHSMFGALYVLNILGLVYMLEWAFTEKVENCFLIFFQLRQILLESRPIFNASSPNVQCPVIVAVSLEILFLNLCNKSLAIVLAF